MRMATHRMAVIIIFLGAIMLLWTINIQRHNMNNSEKKTETRTNTCIKCSIFMHNIVQVDGTKFVSRDWRAEYQAQGSSDTISTANRMLCVVNRQSCIPLRSLLIEYVRMLCFSTHRAACMHKESMIPEIWHIYMSKEVHWKKI